MLEDVVYRFLAGKLGTFIRGGLDREQVEIALGQRGYFSIHDLELETSVVEEYWRRDLGLKGVHFQRAKLGTLSIQARWNGVISVTIADVYIVFSWCPVRADVSETSSFRATRAMLLSQDEQERHLNRQSWVKRVLARRESWATAIDDPPSAHETSWFRSFTGRATAFLLRRLQLQIERIHVHVDFLSVTPETSRDGGKLLRTSMSCWGIMLRQLTLMDREQHAMASVAERESIFDSRATVDRDADTHVDEATQRDLILDRQLRVTGLACYLQPAADQDPETTRLHSNDEYVADKDPVARYDRFETAMTPHFLCHPSDGSVSFRIDRLAEGNRSQPNEFSRTGQTKSATTRVHLRLSVERWLLELSQTQLEAVTSALDYATWLRWRQRAEMLVLVHAPEPYLWMLGQRYRAFVQAVPSLEASASAAVDEAPLPLPESGHRHAAELTRSRWRFVIHCIRAFVASRRRPFGLEGVVDWRQRKTRYLEMYEQMKATSSSADLANTSIADVTVGSEAAAEAPSEASLAALEEQLSLEEILYFRSLADQHYRDELEADLDMSLAAESERCKTDSQRDHSLRGHSPAVIRDSHQHAEQIARTKALGRDTSVLSSSPSSSGSTSWLGWISSALGWSATPVEPREPAIVAGEQASQSPSAFVRGASAESEMELAHDQTSATIGQASQARGRESRSVVDDRAGASGAPASAEYESPASASRPNIAADGEIEPEALTRELGERFQSFVQDHADEELVKLESTLDQMQFEPEAAGLVIEFHVADTRMKLVQAHGHTFAENRLRQLLMYLERAPDTTRIWIQTGDVCVQAREYNNGALFRIAFVESSADAPDEPLIQLVYERRQVPSASTIHALASGQVTDRRDQASRPTNRLSVRGKPLVLVLTPRILHQLNAFGQRHAIPWRTWIEEAKTQFAAHRAALVAAIPDSQTVVDAATNLELDVIAFAPRIHLLSRLSASSVFLQQETTSSAIRPLHSPRQRWSRTIRRLIRASHLESFALQIQLGRLSISSQNERANEGSFALKEMDQMQQRFGLTHRQDEPNNPVSRNGAQVQSERQAGSAWTPFLSCDVSAQQLSVALALAPDAAARYGCEQIPMLTPCGGRARLVLARRAPPEQKAPTTETDAEQFPTKKATPLPASSASIRVACSIDISAIEMHVTPILWQYMLRWRQYWEKSAWTVAPDTESASTPAQSGVTAEPKLVAEAPESTRIDTDEKGALEGLSVGGTTHHQAFFAASRNRSARDQDGVSPQRLRPKLSALSVSAEYELGMETFLIEMHWRGADATLQLWSPTDPPARLTAVSAGLEAAFGLGHRLGAPVPWRVSLATHAPQVQVSQRVADQEPIVLLSPFALRGSLHVQRRADHGESAAVWTIRCGLYTSAFDAILRYQDLELWRTWIRQWSSLLTTSASLPRAIARSVATATASSFPSDTDRIRKAREVSEPSAATCTTTADAAASSTEMVNALKSPQRRDAVAPWNWSALWSALSTATAGSLWTPTQETRRISTLDSRPCIHSTTPKAHPNGNQRSISTSSMSPQLNTVITLWDSATQLQCVLQLDETLPAYVLVLASPESASANDLAPVFRSFLVQRVDPDDETLFVLQPCERSGDPNGWPLPGALGTLNRSGLDPITRLNESIRIGDNPARRETIGRSRREPSSKVRERPAESRSPDGAPLESEPLAILGSSWRSGAPPSSTSTVSDANMIITSEPLVWRACLVTPDGFCLMNAKTGSFLGWNARGQAIQTSQPETVVRLGSSLTASAGARELTAAPQEHPDELTTGAAATSGVSVSFRLESAGALVRLANGGTTGDRCVLPLVALSMSQIELMWQGTGDRQEMQTQCTFALDAYHAGLDTYQPRLHPCRLQLRMQRHTASGLARLWLSPLYREPIRIQGSEQDLLELLVLGEYFGGRRASLPPEYQRAFLFTNDTDAEIEVLPAERSTLRETRSDANLYERALESKVSLPAGNAIGECWESTRIAANAENVSLVVPPSWTPHALWRVSMDRFGRPQVHGASSETRRLQLGVRLGSLPTFRTRWFQWSLDRDTPVATAMDTSADRKALVGRQRDPTWSQTGGSEYARGSPQNPPTVQAQSIELGPDRDTLQIRPRHQTADASDSDLEADEPVASASAALWKRVHWQATQSRTGWSFCLQAPVAVHNACSRTPLRIRCLGLSLDTKDRAHVDNTRIIAPQSSLHIGAVVDIRALTVSFVDARDEETSTDADWCESFSVQARAMRELYGGSVCIAHMVHWPDNRALRVARHVQDDGTIQVWLSPILEFRNLLPVPALVTINEHIVLLESRSRQELFRFPADGRCELAVSVGEVLLERRQYVTRFQLSDREHVESLTQPQPASKVALFSQLVDSPQGYVEASCYLGVAARNAVMLLSSLYTVFNMVPGMSIQVQESGQIPEHERLPPRALSVEPFQAAFLRTSCCRVFGWREPVRLDLVTAQGYFLRLQGIPLALSFATSYDQEQLERSRWYSDIEESGANWVSGTDHTRAKAGAARSFALRPEIVLINELVDTELVVRRAYPSPSADSDPTLVLPPGSMQPFLFPVYAARDFAGNAVAREKAPADSAALQIRVARRPAVGERLQTAKPQPVLASNAAAATSTRGEAEPQGPDRNTNGTLSWSGALPLAVTGSFVVDMADGLPGILTVNAFLERGGCQVVRFQATPADAIPFQLVNGTHKLLCFVQASDRDRALQLLNAQSHRIHWAPPLAQIAFAFGEPLEERTLCIICLDTDPPICFFLPELEAAFLDAPDEAVSNRFVDECQGQSPWHAPDQQAWQRRLIADPGIQSQHSPVLWVRMRATPTYRLLEFFSDTSEGCTEDTSRESASSALRDDGYEMGTPHLNWIRRVHLFVLVPELVVDVHATAAVGGARVGLCLRDLQVATDLDLDTESRHHMQVSLQSIELRNQAPDTPFPVVIRSGVAEDDSGPNQVEPMALEAELVLRRRFGELECAPLRVMVAPVLLHLDAHFLAQSAALSTALSHEWATLHTKTAETPTRGSTGGVSVSKAPAPLVWMPELAAGPRPGASRYGLTWLVLAYLRLTPIDIRLSFHRGTLPRSPDALAGATVLARAAYLSTRERMVTMPSIDGANLQLAGLELRRYPLTSSDELFVLVWSRWTRSILNQWYKLLGSLEVIGAPLAASRSPVTQLREVYSSLMAGRSTARRFSYGAYSAVSAAERVSIDAAQPATQAMARTAGALGLRLLARGLKRLGSGKDTATRERGRNVPNISGRPIDATGLTSSVHAFSDSVPVETITATIDDATSASEGEPLIRWDDDDNNNSNSNDAGNHDLVTRGATDVSRSMDLRQTLLYPSV